MRLTVNIILAVIVFISVNCLNTKSLPVVLIHGIGDSCSNNGMKKITKFFSDQLDTYAVCIETAGGLFDWFSSFKSQAETACNNIKKDANLQGDFSIVGISQGSLLARHIIEACDMPGRVKKYVSIGGPQMGVGKFPHCKSGPICWVVNRVIFTAVYNSYVQWLVGPSGYFKDIKNYNKYLAQSTFLADINNEKAEKNQDYKSRFSALESVVLIKFDHDTMILPKETAWFEFVNDKGELVELKQSDFYVNDYIGLRSLNERGLVKFLTLPGNHLNFDYDDIKELMIPSLK